MTAAAIPSPPTADHVAEFLLWAADMKYGPSGLWRGEFLARNTDAFTQYTAGREVASVAREIDRHGRQPTIVGRFTYTNGDEETFEVSLRDWQARP